MPTLTSYNQFDGIHWETGSVRNFFAHRGFTAPHTGRPYSEAFLLGVSGGITVGYFTFAYQGYDPQCNILTRNTFDPMDTMLSRLGVIQYVKHTRLAGRAVEILVDTLEDGLPAIVWADRWSLPYNALGHDEGMWGALPIVVYGYEPGDDAVHIADRARVPLTVTVDQLAAARGRIKKEKFRLLTLDAPDPAKLASAARLGISDAIKLFTEKPPKGSKNNFGLNALQSWARMLTRPKQRRSWQKVFPAGPPMYAGLTSAYEFAFLYGKGQAQDAERGMYADFLDEAAVLLEQPDLAEAAGLFRTSAALWGELPAVLLPDEIEPFGRARALMGRRHTRFLEAGGAALDEILAINDQLAEIRQSMADHFTLTQPQVETHRERIAAHLLQVHDAERTAVQALKGAMA